MWWKLGLLAVATGFLILLVVPIKTRTVKLDPINDPAPPKATLLDIFGAMHLTATSVILITVIVAVAAFVALRIVRGHW